MRLQRLLKMGPEEIARRSWQQTHKTMERFVLKKHEATGKAASVFNHLDRSPDLKPVVKLFQQGQEEAAAQALLQQFQTHASSRFFEGTTEAKVPFSIRNQYPGKCEEIIESADAVCEGRFDILGYGRLFFGSPVNWHLDPVSGHEVPLEHWSRIDPLDSDHVGDSKVIWEISRHQWMLDLGQAYLITGDEHYAVVFKNLLRDWIQANPVGFGINWSSSLEVAYRLISWCWALYMFRSARVMTGQLYVEMLSWIRSHACYVEKYLSYYFSPNTHLTGEALGLFYAGTVIPEFRDSRRWQLLGEQILNGQIQCQVYDDGVYFEQSTRYQYYTIEIYLHFVILAGRNDVKVSAELLSRLEKMFNFLLTVRQPNGDMPQIGDTDGGWLLPLLRREPTDFSALFAMGAVLFQRGDLAWAAGALTLEPSWFFGSSARRIWDALELSAPVDLQPQIYKSGGYAILRNHWHSNAHHIIFDTGPLGCDVSGGHGHADLLSVQCSVFGEPFIVDAGTGNYTADKKWRNYFRSSAAHSTVMVDGMGQAQPEGPFSWHGSRPRAQLNGCEITESYQLVEAFHDAYSTPDEAISHRRRLLFIDRSYWLIIDDLSGYDEHRIDVRYQLAPLNLEEDKNRWIRIYGHHQSALLLRSISASHVHTDISKGAISPLRGWLSPNYGQQQAAPAVTYSIQQQLPARVVTLCIPVSDKQASPPQVHEWFTNEDTVLSIAWEKANHCIRINNNSIQVEGV